VSQYSVPLAVVEFGAEFASARAGVQDTDVDDVFDAIVVSEREPNFARSVCVNEEDALDILIVDAEPSVILPTETEEAIVTEPVTIPIDEANEQFDVQASFTDPVPSALWCTVHSPYAVASEELLSVSIVR
jgi:hypothetical protein